MSHIICLTLYCIMCYIQVMEDWFSAHRDNPYPSDEEKRALAATAHLREEQVSNWFVNVRKRYWRPAAAK